MHSTRRRKSKQHYPRELLALIAITAILLITFVIIVSACTADTAEDTQDTPQPPTGIGRPTTTPTAETAPETTTEATVTPWTPNETDVEYIAKTMYGEALIVKSDTRRAAVAWCILNRVDAKGYPNTIEGVVTAPYQFSGYDPDHPVTEELRDLAIDVLQRWNAEKNGETEVGRVLPEGYCFFIGDGFENYFTDEWKGTDYWDWSLPSPYEN